MEKDLEFELLLARMKAVQHESALIMEVVKLQRMKIAKLEKQLEEERLFRKETLKTDKVGGCKNCGMPLPIGQVFCNRGCWAEFQRLRKETDAVNSERGTRREDRVLRKENEERVS